MNPCSQCGCDITDSNDPTSRGCVQLLERLDASKKNHCLCKSCLIEAINTNLASLYKTESTETLVEKALPYRNQMPVKELDYYLNEDGFRVMTSWAHLKRGYCCGNGCQHCPY